MVQSRKYTGRSSEVESIDYVKFELRFLACNGGMVVGEGSPARWELKEPATEGRPLVLIRTLVLTNYDTNLELN